MAACPKHVPDAVDDGSIRDPRSAASPTTVLPLLGQALLKFPPQGAWEAKVIDALLGCVRLLQGTRLLGKRLLLANPFSRRCALLQASR